METPVYEDRPQFDWWLRLILIGAPSAIFIAGAAVLSIEPLAGFILVVTAAFEALLFKAVFPTSYQIFPDRIRVALGGPLGFNIPFTRIRMVRPGGGAGFAPSVNFITSARNVIVIMTARGWWITISPSNKALFLDQLARYLGKDRVKSV
jgi:hypothetical protein